MISSILLNVFVVLLGVAFLCALRYPVLAVALGIATFGLEQIVAYKIVFFQINQSAFNIMIAGVIGLSFIFAIVRGEISGCQTGRGKLSILMIWAYVALFWTSSLWSSFTDYTSSLRLLPYFFAYVLVLPYLISDPLSMTRGLLALWVILLLGFIALAFSPEFASQSTLGRAALIIDDTDAMNPLALADMAVLLSLTSLLASVAGPLIERKKKWLQLAVRMCSGIGVGLGLWMTFLISRGETLAGIACTIFMLSCIFAKTVWRAAIAQSVLAGIAVLVLLLAYNNYYDKITSLSPRFGRESVIGGMDIREGLVTQALKQSLSSLPTALVGQGARDCEERFGLYPHSALVQSLVETGILGFVLYTASCLLVLRFGFRTLMVAKQQQARVAVHLTSFMLSLLVYNLIVLNKKGSLIFNDSYMWLAVASVTFDRVSSFLIVRRPMNSSGSSTKEHLLKQEKRCAHAPKDSIVCFGQT